MGESKIEWTEQTWNPIAGCSVVSPGCTNCYAMKMAARLEAMGTARYAGLTRHSKAGPVWTGKLSLVEEALTLPLKRKKPTTYFVNSMSDLFHEDVPDEWIDRVLAVMALAPQHTFQVLTKRATRMRAYFADPDLNNRISAALGNMLDGDWIWNEGKCHRDEIDRLIDAFLGESTDDEGDVVYHEDPMPLPNVWLGVSAEDQTRADERVPDLLATPAAVRFVSAEPLLGLIDFARLSTFRFRGAELLNGLTGELQGMFGDPCLANLPRLDWIIVGGESGPKARPMHPAWARSIRDQCSAAGVAFHFKQWGAIWPAPIEEIAPTGEIWRSHPDGKRFWIMSEYRAANPEPYHFLNVGKKAAGRLLDGVEHNGMPVPNPRPVCNSNSGKR